MSLLSRGGRAAARPARRLASQPPRRFDSHHAGHGESAFHVAGGSATGNESLGRGFYIAVAAIPASIVAYTIASSSDTPVLTGIIKTYREREAELVRQNTVNEAVIQQASMDRHLFVTKDQDTVGPDMVYPEAFNQGSPWNVAAGQAGADLNQLAEHFFAKEKALEDARIARLQDGKVTTVYDDTTGGRLPSLRGKKEK